MQIDPNTLVQRSPEWFEWRRHGIGSSDASVLMNVNQYKTVHRLWLEKTRQVEAEQITNEDMQRGVDFEDEAIEALHVQCGLLYRPQTLQHPKFTFLKASLDGYHEATRSFAEVKCPRAYTHRKTKEQRYIKPEYYAQIQHQYLTSGLERCLFLSYDVWKKDLVIVPVEPDFSYQAELLARALEFWGCVESRKEPDIRSFGIYDPTGMMTGSSVEF